MIVEFRFRYSAVAHWMTPELLERIQEIAGPVTWEAGKEREQVAWNWKGRADLARLLATGVPPAEIELCETLEARTLEQIERALTEIAASVARLQTAAPRFNERVSVAVPGIGLLLLDEVTLERDSCTDMLQERMRDGWRIIAVCPQPDQRRPDYVLGRVNRSPG